MNDGNQNFIGRAKLTNGSLCLPPYLKVVFPFILNCVNDRLCIAHSLEERPLSAVLDFPYRIKLVAQLWNKETN